MQQVVEIFSTSIRVTLILMTGTFLTIGAVFSALAAGIHVMIFAMESLLWDRPAVWKSFGLRSAESATLVRPFAFNQGFYNLFLALGTVAGLVFVFRPELSAVGYALCLFALASMLLASLVLVSSSPKLGRAALIQGAAPLLGIVFLVLSLR